MLAQGTACAIVNTGSKQGITCPPGDTAYNVSKAGVKVLTEALAHSLRNEEGARITAHLLIPGSTFTGMTRRGRTEKPPGAWTPDQVVDMLIAGMNQGDFYILCPDNEVTREIDNRRIPGPRRTSPRTGRRCRAGIPTTSRRSTGSCSKNSIARSASLPCLRPSPVLRLSYASAPPRSVTRRIGTTYDSAEAARVARHPKIATSVPGRSPEGTPTSLIRGCGPCPK